MGKMKRKWTGWRLKVDGGLVFVRKLDKKE